MVRATAAVVGVLLAVLGVVVVQPPPAVADPVRYVDPVFTGVDVTTNLVYGQAVNVDGVLQDLTVDVYQPAGDVETARPLIVWIHGGTFMTGDKSQMATYADYFARRGYVTASINYRLRPNASWSGTSISDVLGDPEFLQSVYQAYADAGAAVAWFRANAATYRIDTDKVVAGGYSAGAVTSLNLSLLPQRAKGQGGLADPRRITAAVSIAGTSVPGFAEHGEPPIYMAHGTKDTTVYYAEAQELCTAVAAAHVPCTFKPYPGYTHALPWDTVRADLVPWLFDNVINEPPFIESMSVHGGFTVGGEAVTIDGRGLSDVSSVRFGSTPAAFTVVDNHRITAIAPPGSVGLVNVRAQDPYATSPTFPSATWWTYALPPAPTVTRIAANSGPSTGGQTVVLTGANLLGATSVRFGVGAAPTFTVDSATQITAAAPPHSPALVNVTVTTPSGASPTVTYQTWYRYDLGPPVVTRLAPNNGPAAGSNTVTIRGTGLTGATSVRFGALEAPSFTVDGDGQITATAPPHPAMLVNVTVTTPLGTSPPVAYKTWYRYT